MNLASQYALSLAAQLQALAATSTVQSDPSLKTSLDELEQCTIGYGDLVEQVCNGFASFDSASGSPTWDPITYPVMLAGRHVLTNSASSVAAQLRALPVPVLPKRVPTWGVVRDNVTTSALDAASGAFSIARASVGTVAKAGLKSIFQRRNPFSTLAESVGQKNVDMVLDKVLNPLTTLQEAAAAVFPRVKTGLDLGLDLGSELGALLAEIVTDGVEYVNDDFAAYKRLEASLHEATALNAQAEFIEQSMKNLHSLARAAVCSAAATAIERNRRSNTAAKSVSTAALRRALSEVSSADADHGVFSQRAEEGFKRLLARGSSLFSAPADNPLFAKAELPSPQNASEATAPSPVEPLPPAAENEFASHPASDLLTIEGASACRPRRRTSRTFTASRCL